MDDSKLGGKGSSEVDVAAVAVDPEGDKSGGDDSVASDSVVCVMF